MKKPLIILLTAIACDLSLAQWVPNPHRSNLFTYEPVCNANRRQVRVKLTESTRFLLSTDVQKDTVLYAVRFKSTAINRPLTGVSYCEPYMPKEIGLFSSYRAKTNNASGIEQGFSQCLVDYNDDGVFDDGTGNVFYFPNSAKVSDSHQYRYEVLDTVGPPEPGCPRPKAAPTALVINEQIWTALSNAERDTLKLKGEVDVIPAREIGIVLQTQKLNESTSGSTAGAALGERVAAANYIDKSVGDGNYSAKGQLGAQLVGAVLGSALDTGPNSAFKTRYTVKTVSGEILTTDKSSKTNDFYVANGVCVAFPAIEQVEQSQCETTLQSFRAKYFPDNIQDAVSKRPKEARLRELKDLFDRGLVSEKIYLEQQKSILDN